LDPGEIFTDSSAMIIYIKIPKAKISRVFSMSMSRFEGDWKPASFF